MRLHHLEYFPIKPLFWSHLVVHRLNNKYPALLCKLRELALHRRFLLFQICPVGNKGNLPTDIPSVDLSGPILGNRDCGFLYQFRDMPSVVSTGRCQECNEELPQAFAAIRDAGGLFCRRRGD